MYNLYHAQRLQMKENLNPWSTTSHCQMPYYFFNSKQSKKGIEEQPTMPFSFSYPQKNHVLLAKPI